MALEAGTNLGPSEILSPLGAGGTSGVACPSIDARSSQMDRLARERPDGHEILRTKPVSLGFSGSFGYDGGLRLDNWAMSDFNSGRTDHVKDPGA